MNSNQNERTHYTTPEYDEQKAIVDQLQAELSKQEAYRKTDEYKAGTQGTKVAIGKLITELTAKLADAKAELKALPQPKYSSSYLKTKIIDDINETYEKELAHLKGINYEFQKLFNSIDELEDNRSYKREAISERISRTTEEIAQREVTLTFLSGILEHIHKVETDAQESEMKYHKDLPLRELMNLIEGHMNYCRRSGMSAVERPFRSTNIFSNAIEAVAGGAKLRLSSGDNFSFTFLWDYQLAKHELELGKVEIDDENFLDGSDVFIYDRNNR